MSFFITNNSSVQRTISGGGFGYVAKNALLSNSAGPAIVTTIGDFLTSKIVIDGNVVSGPADAIVVNENGAQITVGAGGSIVSPTQEAIQINGAGNTDVYNDGSIVGGIKLDQDANNGSQRLSVTNNGSITNVGVGIAVNGDGQQQDIVNTGVISGINAINLGDTLGSDMRLYLFNSGTLSTPATFAISAGAGDDEIINVGDIVGSISLQDGNDLFNGISGSQGQIFGGDGDDRIYMGDGKETIHGGGGNDTLFGNGGGDEIFGGDGSDIMRGGAEGDTINGGSGTDWVYYRQSDAGIELDLSTSFGFGGHAEGDFVTNVERVWATEFADEVNGNSAANYIVGGDGNDIMRGGAGNDIFRGDAGADVMNGGTGFDWLYYTASNAGVVVNLTLGTAAGGHAQGDRYFNMENVNGSRYNDQLTGTSGNNQLFGFEGNDVIRGYFGNDGLNGGGGADRFVFERGSDKDFISDFTNDVDKLDLRAFGFSSTGQVLGNTSVSGNDVFIDLGAGDEIRLVGFAPNIGDLADDLII